MVFHATTLNKHRPITIVGAEFRFLASRKELFFSLMDHWVTKQEQVRASDPERTIIDGLWMPKYCGGLTELAKGIWMKKEELDNGRLVDYALRMDIGAVIRRLGYLMELLQIAGTGPGTGPGWTGPGSGLHLAQFADAEWHLAHCVR